MRNAKIAVVSDIHCPFADPLAMDRVYAELSDLAPDLTHLVMLGDLFEASAASKFDNNAKHTLQDEYEQGALVLDKMRELVPHARRIWCLGNHDANIKADGRLDPGLHEVVCWNNSKAFGDSFRAWEQVPYDLSDKGCIQIGQVLFTHGVSMNAELEALRYMKYTGWHAHRLVVSGHTHHLFGPRPVMRGNSINGLELPYWFAKCGTLGPLRPKWTQRQDTSKWAHGMLVVDCQMGRACQPGPNWDCEVVRF